MKKITFILLSLIIAGCGNAQISKGKLNLSLSNNYPKWLIHDTITPKQTSGIVFVKKNDNTKQFITVDDIGKIHLLNIDNSDNLELKEIKLGSPVKEFLKSFVKWDFEEITYDKYTDKFYISIEGNSNQYTETAGIYEVKFNNNTTFDSVVAISRLNITPKADFIKYLNANIGFEGLAVDKNYLYLGLEGFSISGIFVDSTFIYVVDKSTLKIVKEIPTKELKINTICGLYSAKDNELYGIDRNGKQAFHLVFNDDLDITNLEMTSLESPVPQYPKYSYVASLESITFDGEYLYIIDDPWPKFFVPEEIMNELDKTTQSNFKSFTPVIFKYKF